jgi:hypothetical protein
MGMRRAGAVTAATSEGACAGVLVIGRGVGRTAGGERRDGEREERGNEEAGELGVWGIFHAGIGCSLKRERPRDPSEKIIPLGRTLTFLIQLRTDSAAMRGGIALACDEALRQLPTRSRTAAGWCASAAAASLTSRLLPMHRSLFRIAVFALAFVALPALAAPVEIIPPELRGAAQPQVAVAPGGRIHVVFGKAVSLYHTASADGGRTFSPPVRIADVPKLALGMRRGPRVVATDRLVTVSAIAGSEGNLLAWTSADGGATWSKPATVNTVPNSAREGLHAMASDGKGLAFLTWLDLRSGGMELWGATSRDGGATWSAEARIYASPDGHICECCHPSTAIGPRGEIAVMWRNWLGGARDMYLATSNDGAKTFGPAQKLGEGTWKLNACPMDGGGLAFDAAGKPFTVWRREKSIFAAPAAPAAGPERKLDDRGMQPIPLMVKSGPAFLWESSGQLQLARGASGQPATLAQKALFPAAATIPGKGAIVVWESTAGAERTLMAARVD